MGVVPDNVNNTILHRVADMQISTIVCAYLGMIRVPSEQRQEVAEDCRRLSYLDIFVLPQVVNHL